LDDRFTIRYRTQDEKGVESPFRDGRLEVWEQGFYVNVSEIPRRCHVDVRGILGADILFKSGWASADAVHVNVF
jgi:hypothetical protein